MIITDGSSSYTNMYSNQYCEWYISPLLNDNNNNDDDNDDNRVLVLDFLEQDLVGAHLTVYDKQNGGYILWECNECRVTPRPIISITGAVYVKFTTKNVERTSLGEW